jgi:hypothetical protein
MSGISFRGLVGGSVGGGTGCGEDVSESDMRIVYTSRRKIAVYSKASKEERSGNLVRQASQVTK